MLKKLEYICVVGGIALIGADRIDFFAGQVFFRLSPFLLFGSLVVLIRILSLVWQGTLRVAIGPPNRRQIPYLELLGFFLLISFISTIFGYNPERGLVALFGLVLVAVLGYCISLRLLADRFPEKLVTISISFALLTYLIFCIGGYIAWSHGVLRAEEEANSSIQLMFAPTSTMFGIVPRLSGFSLDANRAAFVLVMYLALLDRFVRQTRFTQFLRFSLVFFVLLTISRSGILCLLAYYLFSGSLWNRIINRRKVFRAGAVVILCSIVAFVCRNEVADLLDLWQVSDMMSDRLSGEQGTSGGNHIELIRRGLATWSSSPRTVVAGIGFAGAPRVLGDFFGDNKYGNFHSLYVSFLAELGLPAFLLFMIILGYPVLGRKGATPWIAAMAAFNVALQSYMEPIFWLALALVWSLEIKQRTLRIFAPPGMATH